MASKDNLLAALSKNKSAPGDLAKDKNFISIGNSLQQAIEQGSSKYSSLNKSLLKTVIDLKKTAKGKKDVETYLSDLEKMLKNDEKDRLKVVKQTGTDPR